MPGDAADGPATRKLSKYSTISQANIFIPVALEIMHPINAGLRFLDEIGDWRISGFGDPTESSFLFQQLFVLVQRFNMVAFLGIVTS